MMSPATPLADAQRQIVEWGGGPVVVIAGAGTGKTRVIVERVRWLLETKGDAATVVGGDLIVGVGDTVRMTNCRPSPGGSNTQPA